MDKSLIDVESIINGDLKMVDRSRRNRNIQVLRKNGTSYQLKQPHTGDIESIATVMREARLYKQVYSDSNLASLRDIIPNFIDYDSENSILVIEFITNSQTLNQVFHTQKLGELSKQLAATLGETMANYHGIFSYLYKKKSVFFPKSIPSTHYLSRPGPEILSTISLANLQLLKLVQRYSEIRQFLEEIHVNWHTQTLIHGDIKWDNVIISNREEYGDGYDSFKMRIVDWEFAYFGDPAWDIGSAFQDFIMFWLSSLPITGKESQEQLVTSTKYPLQSIQPAIRAFWNAYTTEIKDAEANELLFRSARYCAVRLIQTAYESLQSSAMLSNIAVYMVQMSLNILKQTDKAIIRLLGIPFRSYL